ncbi:MAG: hypothetical protein AAF515_22115 [Pseudomonadota bacterium]
MRRFNRFRSQPALDAPVVGRRWRTRAFLLAALLAPTAAADTLVFASYLRADLADAEAQRLRERFDTAIEVVPAEVDGRRYLRLLTPGLPREDARRLLYAAERDGLSAWVKPDDLSYRGRDPVERLQSAAEDASLGPDNPAAPLAETYPLEADDAQR